MEKINWSKAIGFGVVIWAIMFAIVWALMGFGVYDLLISKVLAVVAAGVLSYLFILNVRPRSASEALLYGFSWVVVGMVLDLIISLQLTGIVFSSWEYWVGYALILVAPLLGTRTGESVRRLESMKHVHSH